MLVPVLPGEDHALVDGRSELRLLFIEPFAVVYG